MRDAAARTAPAPAPREHPIIFSDSMVRALLAGRKTQTRRVINPQPVGGVRPEAVVVGKRTPHGLVDGHGQPLPRCPYGIAGDRRWVREGYHLDADTLAEARAIHEDVMATMPVLFYRADKANKGAGCRWRPAIFLPRWASRLLLELTDVHVQRLQDITESDARDEGVQTFAHAFPSFGRDQPIVCGDRPDFAAGASPYRASFACAWDLINGSRAPWSSDPWVWALTFNVVEGLSDV